MENRSRAIWILLFLACGFTVISFNLVQIQLVDHNKYWRMAIENHLHLETIPPRRGSIFDSEGNILAQTQQVCDIHLDGQIDAPVSHLTDIAKALGVPVATLTPAYNPRNRDMLLAANLGMDDPAIGRLRALKLRSVIYRQHSIRIYPNSTLAAHILGMVDHANENGLAGIEKEMDPSLCGVAGEKWVEQDAKGREIAIYQTHETPAVDGSDVTLTIRMSIQHVIEEQLDQIVQSYSPNAAYIIVMDPHTGEVMGMGSRPTFDPNDRTTFKQENLRNRCITDSVEPGSIFKIITLAGALNEGLVKLDTPIFCENGSFYYGGKILRDDEPHGLLTVEEVMAQSSNIGFAKLGLDFLHEEKLDRYARAFGIGKRTGLFDSQGESAGILRPVEKWSALSITRIPMGQEVAATPVQMVTAMSVIANGGRLVVPQLAKQVTDPEGRVVKVFQPHIVRQVISAETAQAVTRALEQVTLDGTAKNIRVPGYSLAGKTGTAQKFVDGAYSHTQFVSSFIGFLPAEDPAFVALVMVDDPKTKQYYGAEVSAPVFVNVAKQVAQILNLTPDQPMPVLSSNNNSTTL